MCGSGAFPLPQQVLETADAQLRGAGFSFAKIAALKDLAAKTLDGTVPTMRALGRMPLFHPDSSGGLIEDWD